MNYYNYSRELHNICIYHSQNDHPHLYFQHILTYFINVEKIQFTITRENISVT